MKNILVTGATGFIGYELACQLVARGLRPRLMVRRPGRAPLIAPLDADLVQGDLLSEPSLRRAVEGVDTVFHLGARASFESYRQLAPTHLHGSERLMRAAIDAGVQTFVYASSLFVYGNTTDPIDETTVPRPALDYGRVKIETETRLRALADGAGITLACIRLPHVYGAQSVLFHQVRKGLVIFPGTMRNRCGHLHVVDAARVMIAAAEKCWSGDRAVADDESVDWRQFFLVLKAHYPRFRVLRIPEWLGHLGATLATPFVRLRGSPSLYTRGTVTGFNLNIPVKPRLLWSELGLEPEFSTIIEGIPAVLDGSLRFRWQHPMLDRRS